MADDNDINIDDDATGGEDVAAGASKKGKGLGGLLPALLKWIAIALAALIFIVTVVIITMKIAGGNQAQAAAVPVTEEYSANKEILDWYSSLGSIRTKTSDVNPCSVIVDVVLGYKKDDKATSTEITQRTVELKDFLRRYFTQKSYEELRPQNEEGLRIEIRNAINDSILSSTKIKDVRFMQLDVIQQ
ncbi:MAG: flagellar basal body-associated FliL family protein [Treponema sp.]|nr:flagellar basal body-associated FliL family protein [Treponema sp.]